MNTTIAAASRNSTIIGRIHVLFKDCMSTLMNRRIHGAERIILIIMVRYTHIPGGVIKRKWMLCLPYSTGFPVEAYLIQKKLLYLLLLFYFIFT